MSSGLYNTHKIDFDTTLDLTRLKPYGDTMNDGKVQTSFTLPVKDDERGEEAARQIAKKMGLEEPNVAYHAALDKEFTFYVVYGSCVHSVNYEDIHVITVESDVMSMEDTNDYIREHIGRKVVMVGASTGTSSVETGCSAVSAASSSTGVSVPVCSATASSGAAVSSVTSSAGVTVSVSISGALSFPQWGQTVLPSASSS